jgi:hypothetical protein
MLFSDSVTIQVVYTSRLWTELFKYEYIIFIRHNPY